jgi:hypothetical protein
MGVTVISPMKWHLPKGVQHQKITSKQPTAENDWVNIFEQAGFPVK